ncbi:hypothetical protein GXM_06668 [Nostoc sphaeroides CCNUC1]|uniref:Uncharacterized protein n=1 Tax=Nostoc sphaeroides CCNUC1 TaxID=2653204 RepID=A0A5P8W943_9NOSO|nr:hypothetical protein GXM_06668 [Nostoc sphaeroides CCNUC1]
MVTKRRFINQYAWLCGKLLCWVKQSATQQSPEMLGFVPQPNLHISRFLALTQAY